jgi:hypothetical protein
MTIMAESATKQVERLATAIRDMQDQGMKVNKNRLCKYMNEEKGDNISIVTVGKYFDQAMKRVKHGSSIDDSPVSAGENGKGPFGNIDKVADKVDEMSNLWWSDTEFDRKMQLMWAGHDGSRREFTDEEVEQIRDASASYTNDELKEYIESWWNGMDVKQRAMVTWLGAYHISEDSLAGAETERMQEVIDAFLRDDVDSLTSF